MGGKSVHDRINHENNDNIDENGPETFEDMRLDVSTVPTIRVCINHISVTPNPEINIFHLEHEQHRGISHFLLQYVLISAVMSFSILPVLAFLIVNLS